VWGFAKPGMRVETVIGGLTLDTTTDGAGVWRQDLPPTNASDTEHVLHFRSAEGNAVLRGVLFGEVFLCSGQSNMAYTPLSMAGMNNATAEIAAADAPAYRNVRLFTVGQGTVSKQPRRTLGTIYHNWTSASAKVVGGVRWKEFSAVCWLFGKEVHDVLGVPVGLISSSWSATSIQVWMPKAANEQCKAGNWSGDRFNAMIAPFAVGPMRLAGAAWYQGESNNGQGRYYSCAFPAMIAAWRAAFAAPRLWFGFVQIAGYRYGGASHPDPSADMRQAQLTALALPAVGVSTAIDTGDWNSIHPPDKQTPAHRLAAAALDQLFGRRAFEVQHAPPLYAGQTLAPWHAGNATVVVRLSRAATTIVPPWATASSTLGQPGSIARNECPAARMPPFHNPEDCGWPRLYARLPNGTLRVYNASAQLVEGGKAIRLSAAVPAAVDVYASSYGRASWPMTIFFSAAGVPVLPWFAELNETRPWVLPRAVADAAQDVADETNAVIELETAVGLGGASGRAVDGAGGGARGRGRA